MNEALRDWVTNVRDTFYCIGTVAGPHPYPAMVRDFQSIIGKEAREQMLEREGRLPDALVACIGGGSNAMGLFHPVPRRPGRADHRRRGRRPRRRRPDGALRLADRRPAGRAARQPDLPAAGRRRADPRGPLDLGRARLSRHRAGARLAARHRAGSSTSASPTRRRWRRSSSAARLEGIIPALEPAHALAHVTKIAPALPADTSARDEHVRARRQGHLHRRGGARRRDLRRRPAVNRGLGGSVLG